MPLFPTAISPFSFSSEFFSLLVQQKKGTTLLTMKLFTNTVNTREIPNTYTLLEQSLPSILRSQCFNEEKLPFAKEVYQTEIGHLFEHILLEYLCLTKLALGCKKATYRGVTNWNWNKEAWGTFHIIIYTGIRDWHIFPIALQKSIALTTHILKTQLPTESYQKFPVEPSVFQPFMPITTSI